MRICHNPSRFASNPRRSAAGRSVGCTPKQVNPRQAEAPYFPRKMPGPSGVRARRMKRELEMLRSGGAPGVSAWLLDDSSMDRLEGELVGAKETPYEGGVFRLHVSIPNEYPFKPPSVQFKTKIYHPNIDNEGRICLDTLNMPPKGSWKPALNIRTVLTTIQALMSTPNPDDGLMPEISEQYVRDRAAFERIAREWTRRHARPDADGATEMGVSTTEAAEPTETTPAEPVEPPSSTPARDMRGGTQPASSEILVADSDEEEVDDNDEEEENPEAEKEEAAVVESPAKPTVVNEPIDVDAESVGRTKSRLARGRSKGKERRKVESDDEVVIISPERKPKPKSNDVPSDETPKPKSAISRGGKSTLTPTPEKRSTERPQRKGRLKRRRR